MPAHHPRRIATYICLLLLASAACSDQALLNPDREPARSNDEIPLTPVDLAPLVRHSSWNAAGAFSAVRNPNANFEAGYRPSGSGPNGFKLFTHSEQIGVYSAWLDQNNRPANTPGYLKNISTTIYVGVRPGQVALHPGCHAGEPAVVRWAALYSGNYLVHAAFYAGDTGPGGSGKTTASLILPGGLSDRSTNTNTNPVFDRNVTLQSGQRVDVEVGPAGDGCGFDTTPFDFTIQSLNLFPIAFNYSFATAEEIPIFIQVQATEPDLEALIYAFANPQHGTLSGEGRSVTYTPDAGFYGTDVFSYTATDPQGASATGRITIVVDHVNDAPIANDASITTNSGEPVPITLDASDPDGDALTFVVQDGPAHGTLSGTPPALTYQPAPLYSGPDAFTFVATDPGDLSSNVATVSIAISNQAPVITIVGGPFTGNEGAPIMFGATGADPEGDPLTYTWNFGDGTPELNGVQFQHPFADNKPGGYDVTLTVDDGHGNSVVATTTANVTNAPPSAAGVTGPARMNEGTASNFTIDAPTDPSTVDAAALEFAFACGADAPFTLFSSNTEASCRSGDGPRTVVVRAKVRDKDGAESPEYSLTTTVDNVDPVATFHASSAVDEGSAIALSMTDPHDIPEDESGLTFAFDCGSGVFGGASSATTAQCPTTDNGVRVVRGTIADKDGGSSSYEASVTVANVAPVVAQIPDATLLAGETYRADVIFTDPGADSWLAKTTYGDGSPLEAQGVLREFAISHMYETAGSFTVTVIVRDDDRGSGQTTAHVDVLSPAQGVALLQAEVGQAALPNGTSRSLQAKLDAATHQFERGNTTAAINQLRAFENEVAALVRSHRISQDDADALNTLVARIAASANS